MDWQQIIISVTSAVIPAIISYLIARRKGKNDIKQATDSNKAEIEKLIKQHEINLEALKEQHRLEMEAKEKEHEYKLQLMEKEYELKIREQKEQKNNDVMTNAIGAFAQDLLSNTDTASQKIKQLYDLKDQLSKLGQKG